MKKIISILLVLVMLLSVTAIAASATSIFEDGFPTAKEKIAAWEEANDKKCETKRYYFLMPDGTNGDIGKAEHAGEYAPTWWNDFNEGFGPACYWYGVQATAGPENLDPWAGAKVEKGDAPGVYYADFPATAGRIIFNNGVDGGMDPDQPIYYKAAQTIDIPAEYYDPGEDERYPEGLTTFDGMIFVIDPDQIFINEYSQKQTCGGDWYYYYGNGKYGVDPEPPYMQGDADDDGLVTVMDATLIQQVLAFIEGKEIASELGADADLDGIITVMDATLIQQVLAGIKEFPIIELPEPQ